MHHTKKPLESQSFSGIYPIYKERGETLATLLERFRSTYNTDAKLTYAGRLDPMAEGLVIILAGDARFEKDTLLGLSKTYEVSVLLGVATDTLDVLGMITDVVSTEIPIAVIQAVLATMSSITSLPYPLYSSVPVGGKPLFVHARAGNPVTVPQKKVQIQKAALLDVQKSSIKDLAAQVLIDIQKVHGDFRQEEIARKWGALFTDATSVTLATIRVEASSGTYMRSLAEWMGQQLGVPAMAYAIKRLRVGEYFL